MNEWISQVVSARRLRAAPGQGLVEYAALLAIVGVFAVLGLMLYGGSVQGGLIRVCAELGNPDCQAVEGRSTVAPSPTPTARVSPTPSSMPTPTAVRVDPDPTRLPAATIVAPEPTPAAQLITMRVKVVVSGKGGNAKSSGIRVVIYDGAGSFVAEGTTDNQGNASFLVPAGTYTVGTFYAGAWQMDGPFAVKNSKVHVINR